MLVECVIEFDLFMILVYCIEGLFVWLCKVINCWILWLVDFVGVVMVVILISMIEIGGNLLVCLVEFVVGCVMVKWFNMMFVGLV